MVRVGLDFLKLWGHAWRFRLVGGLRALTLEERGQYRKLLSENRAVWEKFQGVQRKNPDAYVLKGPFDAYYRPAANPRDRVGEISDEVLEEWKVQDDLCAYLRHLRETLTLYKWPERSIIRSFSLLFGRGRDDLFPGFERHDELLNWMISRSVLSDLWRKLAVLEDRKTMPQLQQRH